MLKKIFYYFFLIFIILLITVLFLLVNKFTAIHFLSNINFWFLSNELLFQIKTEFFRNIYYYFPKYILYVNLFCILIPIYCFKKISENKYGILVILLVFFATFMGFIGLFFPFEKYEYSIAVEILQYYMFIQLIFVFGLNIYLSFKMSKYMLNKIIKLLKKIYSKLKL